MADILALGISHYPPLHGPDQRMSAILKRMLQNPKLPEELRTPASGSVCANAADFSPRSSG